MSGDSTVERGESDNSGPIDLLILPRVSAKLRGRTESTSRASLLPDMIGVASTSSATNVGSPSAGLSERSRTLRHESKSIGSKIDVKIKVPSKLPY